MSSTPTSLDYWRSTTIRYPCEAAREFARTLPGGPREVVMIDFDGQDPEEGDFCGKFETDGPGRLWVITGEPFNWSINPESSIR